MNPLENLSHLFYTFIEFEPLLEKSRISLSSNLSFDPYLLFKQIDRSESGFITADDLYDFFHRCSIRVELRYIFSLVKCYNTHSEGKIFIADFFNIILPHTKPSLKEDSLTRHSQLMTSEVLTTALQIFNIEFEMWEKVERIKFDLNSSDPDPWLLFCEVDIPRSGFLTPSKLKRLMDRFGLEVEEYLVGIAISRLDKDADYMLCFEEFAWGIGSVASRSVPEPAKPRPAEKQSIDSAEISGQIETCDLFGLLKIIVEAEESLEEIRKKLIICPDFNLIAIFHLFDSNKLGFSTESDFAEGLTQLGLKVQKEELSLVFKHYSVKYCKRLSYSQLEKIFLPYLETNIWTEQELSKETVAKVKGLMDKVIRAEIIYEKYRQLLRKQKVNENQSFRLLGKTLVSIDEVKKFMQSWKQINEKEASFVMAYFKKTVYETFNFEEFREEFLPKLKKRL